MPDRSRLTATPTIDRNGRQTTVYRRPGDTSTLARTIPAPSMGIPSWPGAALEPASEYDDRLKQIAGENATWRAGLNAIGSDLLRAGAAVTGQVRLALALENLARHPLLGGNGVLWRAERGQESVRLALAARYAARWTAAAASMTPEEFGAFQPSGGFERRFIPAFQSLMGTLSTIQSLDLLEHRRLPQTEDEGRLLALLWFLSPAGAGIAERGYLTEEDVEYMRLAHREPSKSADLAAMHRERVPAAVAAAAAAPAAVEVR